MVSRFGLKRDKATHPRWKPRGGPHTGGLGSDPDMGAGQRFPSAGIARLPPSKTGASYSSRWRHADGLEVNSAPVEHC